jgi:hypothetical protein
MKREGELMDKTEQRIRDGALNELARSRNSNKKLPAIVVIDKEISEKVSGFYTKGGQIFRSNDSEAKNYEII